MISRIEVVNFKNHAHTIVNLKPGLNVIVGPNGSGKTSIAADAVGYTLFGWLPISGRSSKPLLRTGSRMGWSKVTFDSADEETGQVEVTRYLGSPQWDVAVDGVLIARKQAADEVQDTIKTHLGLSPWHNPQGIYESVVSPPQARITEPFLMTDSPRADYFRNVLGLSKYGLAIKGLLEPIRVLEKEIVDDEKAVIGERATLEMRMESIKMSIAARRSSLDLAEKEVLSAKDSLCPTCGQVIPSEDKESVVDRLNKKAEALTINLAQLQVDLAAAEGELNLLPQRDGDVSPEKRRLIGMIQAIRDGAKELPYVISMSIVGDVSNSGHALFNAASGGRWGLIWNQDYSLEMTEGDVVTQFGLMSVGQRVMAATALFIALSRYISPIPFLILDEPTTSIGHRLSYRDALVQMIKDESAFRKQIIIITHGDDFNDAGNIISLGD